MIARGEKAAADPTCDISDIIMAPIFENGVLLK
jgi:hypothetical protein